MSGNEETGLSRRNPGCVPGAEVPVGTPAPGSGNLPPPLEKDAIESAHWLCLESCTSARRAELTSVSDQKAVKT